jgi:hypothetical protein
MGLLSDLKTAAVARRRFPDDERLTPASLFALVRDMPYERASDAEPETAMEEWRGTSWGKHYLLHALYREFGLHSILLHATHEISAQDWPWLPAELQRDLESGSIPSVHTFIRLEIGTDWMTVDATWPVAAGQLGLLVNERFETGKDMKIACDIDELFHVPEQTDPHEFRAAILERFVGDQVGRRERFIAGLSEWLSRELYQASGRR